MPAAQGKYPRIFVPGGMVGADENGAKTNNSHEYRGRPYSLLNKMDQEAFDYTKEHGRVSIQTGKRILGLYLTVSQNDIQT